MSYMLKYSLASTFSSCIVVSKAHSSNLIDDTKGGYKILNANLVFHSGFIDLAIGVFF